MVSSKSVTVEKRNPGLARRRAPPGAAPFYRLPFYRVVYLYLWLLIEKRRRTGLVQRLVVVRNPVGACFRGVGRLIEFTFRVDAKCPLLDEIYLNLI